METKTRMPAKMYRKFKFRVWTATLSTCGAMVVAALLGLPQPVMGAVGIIGIMSVMATVVYSVGD